MSENTKENDPQPSRSLEADPDFRTRLASSSDVSEDKLVDGTLRIIAEGTAAATGDEFFRSLARCAAQALGARYAFVAETLSEMESRSLTFGTVRILARVYLSFSGNALPAGRGRSHLRDFVGLAGEIPRRSLAAADRRRELYRCADAERAGPNAWALGGVAPGAHGTVGRGHRRAAIFAARGCAELERKQAHESWAKRTRISAASTLKPRHFST